MSLATWKAEFYQRPAETVPADRALAHSLRKWIGLLPKELAKHDCQLDRHGDVSDGRSLFVINDVSCALCKVHAGEDGTRCGRCPLQQQHGCDSIGCLIPWSNYMDDGDPRPMIRALREAYESEYAARQRRSA